MQFSQDLRKALIRNVARHGHRWTGQLGLLSFLAEVFDLEGMPSSDSRFKNAHDDLWQHTINNDDYSESDVLSDPRFNPQRMTDTQFEAFLNKALRIDTWQLRDELSALVEIITPILAHGGFRLEEHHEFAVFEGYRVAEDRSGVVEAPASKRKVTPSERMELLQRISSTLQERFTYAQIFVEGDYSLRRGVPSVAPVGASTARQIASYISDYGETLVELPEEAWTTSVSQWMGIHWDVLVDLWTAESGRSDMVLSVRVFETGDGFHIEVDSVHVP